MSTKRQIAWHKECLKNLESYLDSEKLKLDRAMTAYRKDWDRYDFYRMQITSAEQEGKDGFDAERYKVKKVK